MNDIEISLCNAYFRYCVSIEYRDSSTGFVIVAPFSGIAQHYGSADQSMKKPILVHLNISNLLLNALMAFLMQVAMIAPLSN